MISSLMARLDGSARTWTDRFRVAMPASGPPHGPHVMLAGNPQDEPAVHTIPGGGKTVVWTFELADPQTHTRFQQRGTHVSIFPTPLHSINDSPYRRAAE